MSRGVQRAMKQYSNITTKDNDRSLSNGSINGRRKIMRHEKRQDYSPTEYPDIKPKGSEEVEPPNSNGQHQYNRQPSSITPPRLRGRRSPIPTQQRSMSNNISFVMNGTFQKLLILLFIVVIFDMVYVLDYFNSLDENEIDGPEAGMHHLHESRRVSNLYTSILNGIKKGEEFVEEEIQLVEDEIGLGSSHYKEHQISDKDRRAQREFEEARNILGLDNHKVSKNKSANNFVFDNLSDSEKIEELETEVIGWKSKYEDAMSKLGQNPYPDGEPVIPFEYNPNDTKVSEGVIKLLGTPIPPNEGNDDYKPKKTRAELEGMDTYGVDEKIVKILHSASVEITKDLSEQLPSWEDVVSLYGESPIVHGLETCEPYREAVAAEDRMLGPAGMFNTGTNLLHELLKVNCDIPEAHTKKREPRRNGMRWQVPWGKHNPPTTHRFKNVAKAWGKGIKQDDFMPVVLIKDPYTWMGSQCRHKYTTFWGHDDEHCPNLIRWRVTDRDETSTVRVKFALQMNTYESLLDMWNKWYEEWDEQTFPHLTTRFEDLLFHGKEVTRIACDCVGGTFTKDFEYVEDSAKPERGVHKGANGLVKAMLQYGDPQKRLVGFTDRDRIYASKTVDTHLMRKYSYPAPPLPT